MRTKFTADGISYSLLLRPRGLREEPEMLKAPSSVWANAAQKHKYTSGMSEDEKEKPRRRPDADKGHRARLKQGPVSQEELEEFEEAVV